MVEVAAAFEEEVVVGWMGGPALVEVLDLEQEVGLVEVAAPVAVEGSAAVVVED